jgi:hypothetical protein
MSKVALNVKGVPDARVSEKAGLAVTNCSGTQLANPTPPEVAELATAKTEFDLAVTDQVATQKAAETATEKKVKARDALERAYAKLGGKVGDIANGDAVFIEARGFDVVKTGSVVMVEQVTGLVVTPGDNAGTADWMCDPQKGAIILIETSPDVLPRVWTKQDPSKKSSGTLTNLPSLTRVWVRVAAKGSNNTGGWSDPALVVVP